MPAFDKTWINIFHLTQNGNADKDNILKFSIFRDGITGKFEFKYWTHKKEMLFAMNTKYHMVIELFKARRGKRYQFAITVDDDDLVHENLKDLKIGGRGLPKAYRQAKLFCSNPWEKTLPSNVGVVKNFKMPTGRSKQCCNRIILVIKSSNIVVQKEKIGKYTYKGVRNGKGYWESEDGKSAIWYYEPYREWMVGSKCYLGTQFRGISARQTSVSCPTHNQKRWSFWNGLRWLTDRKSEINLFCIDDYSEQKQEAGSGVSKYNLIKIHNYFNVLTFYPLISNLSTQHVPRIQAILNGSMETLST